MSENLGGGKAEPDLPEKIGHQADGARAMSGPDPVSAAENATNLARRRRID
jgi:hypothetical protein